MADPLVIPAATLVIFRDRPEGAPELLMVQRATTLAFAGGALVFPGGRIDPGDEALAALIAPDDVDAPARIAAIRETLEEVGLAIGIEPLPSSAALADMRAGLHAGQPLGALLGDHRLCLDVLVPFARWRPPPPLVRVFDTRFYLAAMPGGVAPASVDGTENTRLLWSSAADVLAAADDGRITIIYPTRRNLERLALFSSFADAVHHAQGYPIRTIVPIEEERGGVPHLCIPDDLGYPVTAEPLADVRRS